MPKLNKKAWATLTEQEKMSLTLQLGLSKSSWQSGEIMGKSHYKYLELKYRAEYFLKRFTEQLELWDRLIPDLENTDPVVIEYLRLCIESRVKPPRALEKLQISQKINKSSLNTRVIAQLAIWAKSKLATELNLLDLIKDFDRWNNYRILPKNIQEPSAYKRRVKNSHKKHLRNLCSIHPLSLAKLLKLYAIKRGPGYYMPIVEGNTVKMYLVRKSAHSMAVLGEIGFYIFEKQENAREYIENIEVYINKSEKGCKDGLEFWPKHRELIKLAINYMEIQKIIPTRKYLNLALAKHQFL